MAFVGTGDIFDKPSGTLAKAFGDNSGSRYSISYYPDIKAEVLVLDIVIALYQMLK